MSVNCIQIIASVGSESSGPTHSILGLSRALCSSGSAVRLATLGQPSDEYELDIHGFPNQGLPQRLGRSAAMRNWLRQQVVSGHTDILHNHGLWMMPNIYACKAVVGTDVPLVVSPRGTLSAAAMRSGSMVKQLFWPLVQRPALVHTSCFHATAVSELEDIRRAGFHQPVAVIPNGVEVPDVSRGQRGNLRTLLYLGRLHPIKGLDSLLSAWSSLEHRFDGWRLRIVGPDHRGYRKELERLVTSLHLQHVEFTGEITGTEKWRELTNADLFVLPSHSENFAVAVAEALAAGTPCVVTKGAPWGDLQVHGAGWWVDRGKAPLLTALETALSQPPEVLEAMGGKGRAWMRRDFAWGAIGEKMLQTYQWLLGRCDKPAFVYD